MPLKRSPNLALYSKSILEERVRQGRCRGRSNNTLCTTQRVLRQNGYVGGHLKTFQFYYYHTHRKSNIISPRHVETRKVTKTEFLSNYTIGNPASSCERGDLLATGRPVHGLSDSSCLKHFQL